MEPMLTHTKERVSNRKAQNARSMRTDFCVWVGDMNPPTNPFELQRELSRDSTCTLDITRFPPSNGGMSREQSSSS